MVECWLPYGDTEVSVSVPVRKLMATVEPGEGRPVEDLTYEVLRAVEKPVHSEPLRDMLKPGIKVSVAVDPGISGVVWETLRILVPRMTELGVEAEDVTVIVGRRFDEPLIKPRKPRRPLPEGVRVVWHDPVETPSERVGVTSLGTAVEVCKAFREADLKVSVSEVRPHPSAGYVGGRSVILSISSLETLRGNMSLMLDRMAKPGLINGNPVHEDMVEASMMAGLDVSLNVALDERGRPIAVSFGEPMHSFLECVKAVEERASVELVGRAGVVVASPGGAPWDRFLYRALDALIHVEEAVKRSGAVVLVAECSGGVGVRGFVELFSKNPRALRSEMHRRFIPGAWKALAVSRMLSRRPVIVSSALPMRTLVRMGLTPAYTAQDGLMKAYEEVGETSVIIAPHASYTLIRRGT